MFAIAPAALEVVEVDGAARRVADDRVLPAGKLNGEARGAGVVELHRPLLGLGEPQPAAGGRERRRIADFGLDRHDVTHVSLLC